MGSHPQLLPGPILSHHLALYPVLPKFPFFLSRQLRFRAQHLTLQLIDSTPFPGNCYSFLLLRVHIPAARETERPQGLVSPSPALEAALQACPASLLRASSQDPGHEDIKVDLPINKPEIVDGNPSATQIFTDEFSAEWVKTESSVCM